MKKLLIGLLFASQANFASAQTFSLGNQNFASLYNTVRFSQPKNVPWAGSYWAYANDGIAIDQGNGTSPASVYDNTFGLNATKWEKEHHTCSNLSADMAEGCKAWWGHCNAWSAAAIKEPEPRKPITMNGKTYSVADQKAYLTELWMASGALFEGQTNKSLKTGQWVFNPNSPEGMALNREGVPNHKAFWDVSPRMFLMIFTNYVGIMKQGVVIDRFTGEEVWNQPVVGYRILPIAPNAADAKVIGGVTLYPVKMAVKIYWADDGVQIGHVSQPFSIAQTDDTEAIEDWGNDYTTRLLKFTLYFDAPVVMNGTQVASAGNIVGQGVWHHQEFPQQYGNMNQTHPDFIWQPTYLATGGSQNPQIVNSNVRKVFAAATTVVPPPGPGPVVDNGGTVTPPPPPPVVIDAPPVGGQIEVSFHRSSNFQFATLPDIKFKIQNLLTREGINAPFVVLPSGSGGANLTLKLTAPSTNRDAIVKLLNGAGIVTL